MSKSILRLILLSIVFLFSLALMAGAQTMCEGCFVPTPVVFAYMCGMDCPSCPEGDPQCKSCDGLENFFGQGSFTPSSCLPPCGPIVDCEQGPRK